MKMASSLSELGFDTGDASSGFFRPVSVSDSTSSTAGGGVVTLSAHRLRLTKVSVISAGNVGMAIAQTILTRYLADDIALVNALPDKLRGEMLDLQHAAAFLSRTTRLVSDTDMLPVTGRRGPDFAVVAAGGTRLDPLHRNVALLRNIVLEAPLLVVSNPGVDVLTCVARKLPVGFPSSRFIVSGTNLDPFGFRFIPADAEHLDVNVQYVQMSSFHMTRGTNNLDSSRFHVNAQDVNAYMVGEHGDNSVAVVSVAGVPVLKALEGIRLAVVDSEVILKRDLADQNALVVALPDKLRGVTLDLQHAAAFLPRTRLVSDIDMSVARASDDLAIVTAGARQIKGGTNVALFRPLTDGPSHHRRRHRPHRQRCRAAMTTWTVLLFLCLALAWFSSAACASRVLHTSSSTAGTATPRAAFCGSCCCSAEDDLTLQGAFLNEVKAHGYEDAACRSELKAYICAVCLAPAPASDPFNSNTTNNSSLPLGCAAAPSSSGSIHDVTSEPPPTPDYWLPADDDSQASKMPAWLIALIPIIGTLLSSLLLYGAKLVCCSNCCNHNKFFVREA